MLIKSSKDCIIMRYVKFSAMKLFIAPNGSCMTIEQI